MKTSVGCQWQTRRSRSHLISQELQLCQEVVSELKFVSHCALLHLGPHGFGLLADGLLYTETTAAAAAVR